MEGSDGGGWGSLSVTPHLCANPTWKNKSGGVLLVAGADDDESNNITIIRLGSRPPDHHSEDSLRISW